MGIQNKSMGHEVTNWMVWDDGVRCRVLREQGIRNIEPWYEDRIRKQDGMGTQEKK